MEAGGCPCWVDNAPQDGVSAVVAKEPNSRLQPMVDSPSPLCLPLATQQWKKKTIQAGLYQHRLQMAINNAIAVNPNGRV